MKFGSLFSGIGGFDLGFERAGMECAWQCEIDEKANLVLEKHWPNVKRYGDIREVDFKTVSYIDVLCGGFPCQPHSVAGKRLASNDERDLWHEYKRAICEIKPKWIVAENVMGLLSSEGGRFFGGILKDLAECGYDATWRVLRASQFGAIHKRERIYLIANSNSQRIHGFWEKEIYRFSGLSWCKNVGGVENLRRRSDIPKPIVRRYSNGFSIGMDRLKQSGNAVVPQIAEWIGKRIMEIES